MSQKKPLTLVRLAVEQWRLPAEDAASQIINHLSAVVQSSLGTESVIITRRRDALLLALPEIAKDAAQALIERISDEVRKSLDPASAAVHVKVAAYPDDGTAAEMLLRSVEEG